MKTKIIKASREHLKLVSDIANKTISQIYPHYYPTGAVEFFKNHHNEQNIMKDIENGRVYLLLANEYCVGTVTIKQNEICRLFVLPEYQKQGFGRELLDFAEEEIAKQYSSIHLDASFPAKVIYVSRGYEEIEFHQIETENEDYLCYDVMNKKIKKNKTKINYDGKIFIPKVNTGNGNVNGNTKFVYHQEGNDFYAEYQGGNVKKGNIIGRVRENGDIDYFYHHINMNDEVLVGRCHSEPTVLKNGKIVLHEKWKRLNGDFSEGESLIEER